MSGRDRILLTAAFAAASWLLAPAMAAAAESEPAGPRDTVELLLPQIVLELEDISVVHLEARLPPEQELLPPDRRIPLPEAGELAVGEPSLPRGDLALGEQPVFAAGPISADVALGGGTVNRVSARVRLVSSGTPGLDLSFSHESLDGFSGRPPGAGYGSRDDRLDGTLAARLGGLDLQVAGIFADGEIGLQGQGGGYAARALRTLAADLRLSGAAAPWLTLGAGLAAGGTAHTLSGPVPLATGELRLTPSVEAAVAIGAVKLGVQADYGFRDGAFGPAHRFRTSATIGAELGPAWSVDASVGWHWTSGGLSTVPFALGLSGAPLDALSFSVRGGYRSTAIDLADLLAPSPWLAPAAAVDSAGWFSVATASLSIARELAANLSLTYAAESAMPDALTTPGADGLFAVWQRPADRLTLGAGARWNPADWITLNAAGTLELAHRPWYAPWASVDLEASTIDATGASGLRVSAGLAVGSGGIELPEIDLGGFLRLSPAVRLRLDASDLLALLAGGRVDLLPYLRPGLLVTGAVQIQL